MQVLVIIIFSYTRDHHTSQHLHAKFGRYRYKRLPFGSAPAEDMFQQKIDEIFKYIPNVFGIADDILVVGYDSNGKDHDDTL